MKTTDFSVGQELFYVQTARSKNPAPLVRHVVKKIGRKWITAGLLGATWADERFDPETMRADGGAYTSPGIYYLSESVYSERIEDEEAWAELNAWLRYRSRPANLKSASIRDALKILQAETIL